MTRYDTYGFTATTLAQLAPRVQQLLGLPLTERDSSYYAGTYYLYKRADRTLRLYSNYDAERRGWVRAQYSDYSVLLEASGRDDMPELERELLTHLGGAALLSSTTLPDDD